MRLQSDLDQQSIRLRACRKCRAAWRRGIACRSADACARCDALLQRLKQDALPAFGVEDDLLTMPHSVLVKIQFGGLLGVQRLIDAENATAESVSNINALVMQAAQKFPGLDELPCAQIVDDMTGYKPRRRGKH